MQMPTKMMRCGTAIGWQGMEDVVWRESRLRASPAAARRCIPYARRRDNTRVVPLTIIETKVAKA